MRTAVTIDDVLAVARALANRNGASLGRALSGLSRRGLKGTPADGQRGRGAVFAVESGADPITSEDVCRSLSDWP